MLTYRNKKQVRTIRLVVMACPKCGKECACNSILVEHKKICPEFKKAYLAYRKEMKRIGSSDESGNMRDELGVDGKGNGVIERMWVGREIEVDARRFP